MGLLLWFLGPVGRYVGGAILLALAAWGGIEYLKSRGAAEHRAAIEKVNADAATNADAGERLVRRCYDAGGLWNNVTGRCGRAP